MLSLCVCVMNSNPAPAEESLSEGYEENDEPHLPPYHPSAPSHELFYISTTIDPSHVISLIRKLLPTQNGYHSLGNTAHDLHAEGSKPEKEENISENGGVQFVANQNEAMDTGETFVELPQVTDDSLHHQQIHHDSSAVEATWEESGCTLWDLAANETHAELMVQNLILEVLLANLKVSHSARIKEICLGIIGNLACHEGSRKQIASKSGLIDAILDHLFLDDAPCLCEVFRLITLCFQGGDGAIWLEALNSEHILSRILWIVENALNIQLIEKSVGLLLAIIGSQQEINIVLLPPLVKLGLPSLLINLLAFEMSKLRQERISERYSLLDVILQAIEAFSVVDDLSPHVCSNKDLFILLEELIKLPDKSEIASSCVTAAVLVANILTESANLVSEISQGKLFWVLFLCTDAFLISELATISLLKILQSPFPFFSSDSCFLEGLFSIFPFASDDNEARNALWSIIARLVIFVEKSEISTLTLQQYFSVLVSNTELIEDELLDDQFDNSNEESKGANTSDTKLSARSIAVKAISEILSHWKVLKLHQMENSSSLEYNVNEEDIHKLLDCCSKFIKQGGEKKKNLNLKRSHTFPARSSSPLPSIRDRHKEKSGQNQMDYNLAALKLLCSQLKESHEVQPNSESHPSFTLGSILFQRAWLQGILVSEPSSSSSDDTGRLFLDDGTGAIELLLSGDFRNRQWESGMYVMVVGGYFLRTDDLPIIKVHKIVDLSPFPDRESMWYLEVMEVFKRFYQPLSGY